MNSKSPSTEPEQPQNPSTPFKLPSAADCGQVVAKRRQAYSYARFSTVIQALGDSLRRQYELSDKYAAKHNLQINRTLTDRGISGFRSDNLKQGALGAFIRAIYLGKVKPGSILLVESLDRLSRDGVTEQLNLFLTIINAGVEIVTLADERNYTKQSIDKDPTQLIISIVFMIRGWEESERKSDRLKHVWQSKRDDDSGKALTRKCPFWLTPSTIPGKRFDEIPERVEVVRLIFRLACEGKGARAICTIINKQGIKPWGHGKWWNSNYVRRILRGRAVLGEYQPRIRPTKQKRLITGEPKEGYYPAIIDKEIWQRANCMAAPGVRGKNDGSVSNLLSRLVYDGPTGTAMRFRGARGGGLASLFSAAVEKGDPSESWSYDLLEESVLQHLERLDWDGVLASPADTETARRRRELTSQRDTVELQLQRAIDVEVQCNKQSPAMAAKIVKLEQEKRDLEQQLATIDASGGEQNEITREMREAREEFLGLVSAGDAGSRIQLRAEIRLLIKRIDLWSRPAECVEIQPYYPLLEEAVRGAGMEWKGSPANWPCYRITFANGESRWILCERRRIRKRKSKALAFETIRSLVIVLPNAGLQ